MAKKPKAKTFMAGAVHGGGNFNDQVFAAKRDVAPAGLTTGEIKMEGAPASGTSIFDPVLCELAYRWYCPPGGVILDPFAGGSVRGIVASKLGRRYVGDRRLCRGHRGRLRVLVPALRRS